MEVGQVGNDGHVTFTTLFISRLKARICGVLANGRFHHALQLVLKITEDVDGLVYRNLVSKEQSVHFKGFGSVHTSVNFLWLAPPLSRPNLLWYPA